MMPWDMLLCKWKHLKGKGKKYTTIAFNYKRLSRPSNQQFISNNSRKNPTYQKSEKGWWRRLCVTVVDGKEKESQRTSMKTIKDRCISLFQFIRAGSTVELTTKPKVGAIPVWPLWDRSWSWMPVSKFSESESSKKKFVKESKGNQIWIKSENCHQIA